MEHDIDVFLENLITVRQLSNHTIRGYRRDLIRNLDWCHQHDICAWADLQNIHIRAYAGELKKCGLSGRSIQRALSALRTFFQYLIQENKLSHNPSQDIPTPKSSHKLPKVLNVDQVSHLLDADEGDWHMIRDHAMFELFYSSGLRLSELVSLDCSDMDLKAGGVRVMGKGKKQRDLPVGSKAKIALKEWLLFRGDCEKADSPALFISQRGLRISQRSVQVRLKSLALKKGLTTNVSPHTLRHSFASHMLESCQDLRVVQELLGHNDISTTQIYTQLDFKHLAEVYDAAHPRARKK